ncbi:MAG: hypothetical protein ACLR1T_09380 [Evtepia gabavorous]
MDQAKALLLASRPGSRELAAALDFMEHPPEAYTKNVDQLTTLLATAVTYDRQQVIADRNICRNGTDLMGEGTRLLLRTDREPSTPPLPCGALGIARRGWKRDVLEQVTLCEGRPPWPPARCWPRSCPRKTSPAPSSPTTPPPPSWPAKGPIWCWPTEFWLRKTGI